MLSTLIVALGLGAAPATAAEVVWLTEPNPAEAARVSAIAGAKGTPITGIAFRAAATDASPDDTLAWRRLETTLAAVRAFESRLDGEGLIMRDLAGPIAAITLLQSDNDRARLRQALAYQGFAVHRFAQESLATDAQFADYRVDVNGQTLVSAWVDAAGLDPSYTVTAYDIAEAPERIAYGATAKVVADALPATISANNLPGGTLYLNGTPHTVDSSGLIRVPPGRHLLHLQSAGHILARWELRLNASESATLAMPIDDNTWKDALARLDEGPTPRALVPSVQALGGEVWIARDNRGSTKVLRVTPDGVTAVALPRPSERSDTDGTLMISTSVGGGWMWSGDFLASHPDAPATFGTVNAFMPEVAVELTARAGLLVVDAGASLWVPLGTHQTARYGDNELRPRPMPFVAAGLPWVRALGGYLFPHHPLVGLRAELPLKGNQLALRAEGRLAPAPSGTFRDGSDWQGFAVRSVGVSIVGRATVR